jgi:HK97 family phage prohead protease
MQRRFLSLPGKPVRIEQRGTDPPVIVGYAAPFWRQGDPGTEYRLYDDLVERIMPGCFDRACREDDVRALFNHNVDFVHGRLGAGTLALSVDSVGLRYEIKTPETHAARDVLESIRRGDVTGSSFSFIPHENGMKHSKEGARYVRELHSVQVFDVGPVTFPAYTGSSTGVRALEDPAEARRDLENWLTTKNALGVVLNEVQRRALEVEALLHQRRVQEVEATMESRGEW